jgi:predicted regulator of Ras-like GTPase activity (Roadblock/LC7/MglB family)
MGRLGIVDAALSFAGKRAGASKRAAAKASLTATQTPEPSINPNEGKTIMSTDISAVNQIAGFIGACLVDSDSGLMLASEGGNGKLDLDAASALNTQVVKAKMQAIEILGLKTHIEDILITLGTQFHLIRPLEKNPSLFMYVALDKKTANLGMARMQVKNIESKLAA